MYDGFIKKKEASCFFVLCFLFLGMSDDDGDEWNRLMDGLGTLAAKNVLGEACTPFFSIFRLRGW
jgi:hypothetical protein